MKKRQRLTGYFILACALFLITQSIGLSLGPPGEPGPGFLGFFLGLGLAVCAVVLILHNRGAEGTTASGKPFWEGGAWKRPLFALGVLAGFVVLMWLMGTIPTLVLFFLLWLRGLEKTSWWVASSVAGVGSACFYLVFEVLLQIPLPKGIFFA
jgi:putative tricarboxylic transport membrane protein